MKQSWMSYFINMLDAIKSKSKDRSTKVGAIIVGKNNNILSTGFNGFPRGVFEEIEERHSRPNKYLWTEHSERNAIYNAARHGVALDGSTIYVDWIPCARCARAIIQSGIVEVIVDGRDYESKESYWNERWEEDMKVSKQMFLEAGIDLIIYKG